MKVVFRVDASLEIGTGHVMRCLVLANGLRERGVQCFFVGREHSGNLINYIRENGFEVFILPLDESNSYLEINELQHARWLGCDWQTDSVQTKSILECIRPDWLVVDHYALDARWETKIKTHAGKIMVIDDLADRVHDCDLLLDQNYIVGIGQRYQDKVPGKCRQLLGPKYALLQSDYAELYKISEIKKSKVKRIFMFFGNIDQHNMTSMALSAFLQLNYSDIKVDVVISSSNPHFGLVSERFANYENIYLHSNMPTLAPLILDADIAICSGGVNMWERCVLGLPSIVVILAKNQRESCEALSQTGAIRLLADHTKLEITDIMQALEELIEEPEKLVNMSRSAKSVMEGWHPENIYSKLAEIF